MATFLLTISQGPERISESHAAYKFAHALLTSGHQLLAVFFWQNGVNSAQSQQQPAGDEWDPLSAWPELAERHGLELICCSTAALRRGVLDDELATESEQTATLASPFRIGGLGELVVLSERADRVVQF